MDVLMITYYETVGGGVYPPIAVRPFERSGDKPPPTVLSSRRKGVRHLFPTWGHVKNQRLTPTAPSGWRAEPMH